MVQTLKLNLTDCTFNEGKENYGKDEAVGCTEKYNSVFAFYMFVFIHSNLDPEAQFSTSSWFERIIILGASKPSKVTLKMAGESLSYYTRWLVKSLINQDFIGI